MDIERIGRIRLVDVANRQLLSGLFSSAYGDNYRGDEVLRNKLEEANFALVGRDDGEVSAGCVVDGGRITTIGTTCNPQLTRNRSDRMVDFLENIGGETGVSWISIGLEYERMQKLAEKAGMYRVKMVQTALELLESSGELDRYSICSSDGQPVVISKRGYNQNIWKWE